MIDGLMFLARTESPETQIMKSQADVDHELATVSELYEPAAAEAGVDIEIAGNGDHLVAALDRPSSARAQQSHYERPHAHAGGGPCASHSAPA